MGSIDKMLRILVAIIVAALYFFNIITGMVALGLFVLAAIFVLTSVVSFCPLYAPFGINTCSLKDKE